MFKHYVEIEISGRLPNGAENRERIKIADLLSCWVMKTITFGNRGSEKDAYDLYVLCDSLGGDTIARSLFPLRKNKLMRESLSVMREKFNSPNALGPTSVADFLRVTEEERERIKRRVFELFQFIVARLEK